MQTNRSLSSLTLGHLAADLTQGSVPALAPFFVSGRHWSYAAAAGLVLAMNCGASIIQPLFGWAADRLSLRWMMPAGLLVAGCGLAASGALHSYAAVFGILVLAGCGVAAFHPVAASLVHTHSADQRATALSVFAVGGTVGYALGPLMATRAVLWLGLATGSALLLLPPLVAAALMVASWPPVAESRTGVARPSVSSQTNRWGAFGLLTLVVSFRSVAFLGLNTFLPLHWVQGLGQSQASAGLALTLLLTSGVAGMLVGGRAADRSGGKPVIAIGLCLATVVLLGLWECSSVRIAWLLLIPLGFSLFAPFSVLVAFGQQYLPRCVGTASGVTLGLAVTVGGLVAPLLGRLADLHGVSVTLPATALFACVAFLLSLLLPAAV